MDDRRGKYKAAITAGYGRRRRQDETTQIRKKKRSEKMEEDDFDNFEKLMAAAAAIYTDKREENLKKKRSEEMEGELKKLMAAAAGIYTDKREENLRKKRSKEMEGDESLNLEKILATTARIYTDDSAMLLEATTQLRILLKMANGPVIEKVILAGIGARFVEFLSRSDYPQLQFEAASVLNDIASMSWVNTQVMIDYGVVPIFVKLLGSPCEDVREQAVSALGNVADHSPRWRDLVMAHDALSPLLALLNEQTKLSMLRTVTRTLSTFFKGKPQPVFEQISPALPALERLIHSNDEQVLTHICLALSYLSNCTNKEIQAVIEINAFPRLVELLLHPSSSVIIHALTTVGNIASVDDQHTQYVVDHRALPYLRNLLTHKYEKTIKKEACWTISNMTAGGSALIQAVIDADIIDPLGKLIRTADFDVKKDAAWAICNITIFGTDHQIKFLVSQGCIGPLCDLLGCRDATLLMVCLGGLENILRVGKTVKILSPAGMVNLYAKMIKDSDGFDKIEHLQSHDNTEISEKAVEIVENKTYWSATYDDSEDT